jgi:hypothetical protein
MEEMQRDMQEQEFKYVGMVKSLKLENQKIEQQMKLTDLAHLK